MAIFLEKIKIFTLLPYLHHFATILRYGESIQSSKKVIMIVTTSSAAAQWNEKLKGFRAVAKGEGWNPDEINAELRRITSQPREQWDDLLQAKVAELVEANVVIAEHEETKKKTSEADTLHTLDDLKYYLQSHLELSDTQWEKIKEKIYEHEDSIEVDIQCFNIAEKQFKPLVDRIKEYATFLAIKEADVIDLNLQDIASTLLIPLSNKSIIYPTPVNGQNQTPQEKKSPKHPLKGTQEAPENKTHHRVDKEKKSHTGAAVAAGVAAATAGYFASRELNRRDEIKHTQAPTKENQEKMAFSTVKAVAWGAVAVGAIALAVHYGTGGKFTEMVKNSASSAGKAR